MKWEFVSARHGFDSVREEWNSLNASHYGNHILLDSRFVEALVRHFAAGDTITAVCRERARKGIALLNKKSAGVWQTFQPSQSPLGLILFEYKDEGYAGARHLLRALPGYGSLLGIFQQDPSYSAFSPVSDQGNVQILPYIETPWLQLSGDFDTYWQGRSKNLRHNLDRQSRRIHEQGRHLDLAVKTHPSEMADCLKEYARIESAGWKAAGGTAISQETQQGHFYQSILEEFSQTAEAMVFQLKLDGQVVASDLCLLRNGMLVVLKTTYDERVEKLSPALLMRREIVRWLYNSRQARVIEFYGPLKDWHTQWMTDKRIMFHVNVYRNSWIISTREFLDRFRIVSKSDT